MSTHKTINSADLPKELMRFAKQHSKRGRKAMLSATVRSQRHTVQEVDRKKTSDRGTYRRSWKVAKDPDGGVLHNDAPHAPYVEEDTRPHWAPLQPIIEWVLRKILKASPTNSTQTLIKRSTGLTKKGRLRRGARTAGIWLIVAVELAKKIRYKIAKKGTRGKKIMKGSQNEYFSFVKKEMEKELRR